jgi:Arc/MetJ-type ribon-helix-helix transcriptional regulator
LEEYDDHLEMAATEVERAKLPREVAELAHDRFPGEFGNSADAIEKLIRRLLKKRERRRSLEAARSRWLTRGRPQTKSVLLEALETHSPKEPDAN